MAGPLDRGDPLRLPHQGLGAGPAGLALLRLPRGLRPVGKCHGHAFLDRRGGAHLGIAFGLLLGIQGYRWPLVRKGHHPGSGPDADRADLRLSGAGAAPVRFRPGVGDRGHHHLCHAADGTGDHAVASRRAGRDRRVRAHGRLHPPADDVAGAGAGGPAEPDDRRQPGHHAVAEYGHHRLDDRRRRPGLRRAGLVAPPGHRRRHRSRRGHHPSGHRPGPAVPGLCAQGAAVPPGGAARSARPP